MCGLCRWDDWAVRDGMDALWWIEKAKKNMTKTRDRARRQCLSDGVGCGVMHHENSVVRGASGLRLVCEYLHSL